MFQKQITDKVLYDLAVFYGTSVDYILKITDEKKRMDANIQNEHYFK